MQSTVNSKFNFTANRMSYAQAKYFDDNLRKHKNTDIICHEGTDKDAINSALAMSQYLEQKGINSRIILSGDLKALDIDKNRGNFVQSEDFIPPEKNNDTSILCVDFSSPSRISPNIQEYINNSKDVYCIDHHRIREELEHDCFYSVEPIDRIPKSTKMPYYIDITAKSATSIIYRFFEALGFQPSHEQNYEMFTGLASDVTKKGHMKCDGEKGEISVCDEFKNDKNSYEIYENLRNNLNTDDIAKISQEIDITSNLTDDEKEFYQYLHKNMQLSPNGKIAYTELPIDDEIYQNVGGDNPRTSAIMTKFRQSLLENKNDDEKLKNIRCAMIFYKANDCYRISAHSKDENILDYFSYLKNDCKISGERDFEMGGHQSRAGGKINSLNPRICHKWVQDIVQHDEFFVNE